MSKESKKSLAVGRDIKLSQLPERWRDKIEIESNSGCWLWTGAVSKSGYAIVVVAGRNCQPRNLIWEQFIGPIEKGIVLDHLCHTPSCINPAHAEAITHRENIERSLHANGLPWRTHCRRGHEYAVTGLYMVDSHIGPQRRCKVCDKMRAERWRERRLAGIAGKRSHDVGRTKRDQSDRVRNEKGQYQ